MNCQVGTALMAVSQSLMETGSAPELAVPRVKISRGFFDFQSRVKWRSLLLWAGNIDSLSVFPLDPTLEPCFSFKLNQHLSRSSDIYILIWPIYRTTWSWTQSWALLAALPWAHMSFEQHGRYTKAMLRSQQANSTNPRVASTCKAMSSSREHR